MVYKKSFINNFIFLMFLIFLNLTLVNKAYASEVKVNRKEALLLGLKQISDETKNLKDMRDIRFEKLKKDLDDFIEIGRASCRERV